MKSRIWTILVTTIGVVLLQSHLLHAATFNAGGVQINKKVKPLRAIKRHNVVSQSLDFSCGAAGLSTLLTHFLGDPVSEEEIISVLLESVPIEKVRERKGFSLFDLKRFAESRGYEVTGYQMDFDFLRDLDVPVLVPITFRSYNHFVVVRGVAGDRIFLADPAAGNVSMKIDQFEHIWASGIGLVIKHTDEDLKFTQYALKVKESDLLITDYKQFQKLMNQIVVRTAIFPSEF